MSVLWWGVGVVLLLLGAFCFLMAAFVVLESITVLRRQGIRMEYKVIILVYLLLMAALCFWGGVQLMPLGGR